MAQQIPRGSVSKYKIGYRFHLRLRLQHKKVSSEMLSIMLQKHLNISVNISCSFTFFQKRKKIPRSIFFPQKNGLTFLWSNRGAFPAHHWSGPRPQSFPSRQFQHFLQGSPHHRDAEQHIQHLKGRLNEKNTGFPMLLTTYNPIISDGISKFSCSNRPNEYFFLVTKICLWGQNSGWKCGIR